MRRSAILAVLAVSCLAGPARAYEYTLQFTPNPGARGLVVAGYIFSGNTVVGNCSYSITTGGSGKGGGGGSHTTYYGHTCTWDLFGNLLSMTQGAPKAPPPLSIGGGLTVYARNAAGDVTGIDTAHGNTGFVNTRSAQYAFATPSGGYVFLSNQNPVAVRLTVRSEGDFPLVVSKIDPVARLAKASVWSTNCQKAPVKPGAICTIVVKYDPRSLPPGDDPYTAYDSLTVGIVSNSGQAPDFSESIEVPVAPGG
jgi:hypothetical protein